MNSIQLRKTDTATVKEIRQKISYRGIESISDIELLCLILRTGDEYKTVREQAEFLLRRYGTLKEICQSETQDLIERNPGITNVKALCIKTAFELGRRVRIPQACGVHINGPADVFNLMREEYAFCDRECFKVLLLTAKNYVISVEDVSMGTLTSSLVHVREVYKKAVAKSAYSIVAVHNHPSGDPTPSSADDELTESIRYAGDVMGIPMADHVIIGSETFHSYRAEDNKLRDMLELRKGFEERLTEDEKNDDKLEKFLKMDLSKLPENFTNERARQREIL